MTRVVTVCGSLQQASANRAALDVVAAVLRDRFLAEVDDVALLESIPPFDPTLDDPATLPAAVQEWRARLRAADGIVIAAPEYAGGLAGALKNALDWLPGSGELYARCVGIVAAGTTGGAFARQELARTITWQGGHVVAELGIAAPRTKSDDEGRLTDPFTIGALEDLAATVVAAPHLDAGDRLYAVRATLSRLGVDTAMVNEVITPIV